MAGLIRVVPRKEEIRETGLGDAAAVVVIDALRATSTIATALAAGARAVYPCADAAEARRVAAAGEGRLLAGEAGAIRIPGFDLGNSPREFVPAAVSGKEIVMVTTNGTRAIRAVHAVNPGRPRSVLLAAFVNCAAAAAALAAATGRDGDAVIVCSGTAGRFSLDDFLCAGALIFHRQAPGDDPAPELDDLARAARDAYLHNRGRLVEALTSCRHARILFEAGLADDIDFCGRENIFDVVPAVRFPAAGDGVAVVEPLIID